VLSNVRDSIRICALLAVACLAQPAAAWETWTLDDAFLPERVSLSVNFRSRFEYLSDPFVAGVTENEQAFVLRTLVHGSVRLFDGVKVGAEFEDSRAYYTLETPLNTTIVDAAELLRAYLSVEVPDTLGGTFSAQGGRITMDIGSRRFVARNRFRNTINGFTGIDLDWKDDAESGARELRAFWTLPVQRLPDDAEGLRNNSVEFDRESLDLQFWGIYAASDLPFRGFGRAEIFFYGLNEDDSDRQPTRNRNLYTPGFRWFRNPASGEFDFQFEAALQFGSVRANTTSTEDLDQFAQFYHAEFGYSFDAPCAPRVLLQYDYASGDKDPYDDKNQRFYTLYGARRFDFGPTGIYGPFARANIQTPGIRLQLKPHSAVTSFVAFRAYWLASDRDAWTTAGVRDPTGDSGSYVGSQLELRIRWHILPGNLLFETGYAHLFAGTFIDEAPNSNREGDSDYVYSQVTLSF